MFKFIIEGVEYSTKKNDKDYISKLFNILLEDNRGKIYEVLFNNKRILSGIMVENNLNTILEFCEEA